MGGKNSLTMCLSLALLLLSAACTGGRPVIMTPTPSPLETTLPQVGEDYRLGPGDLVGISFISAPLPEGAPYLLQYGDTLLMEFHGNEHLNRNLTIRPDGVVTVPYLGELQAQGKEPLALARELERAYRDSGVFHDLEITLSVVGFNARLKELQNVITTADNGVRVVSALAMDGSFDPPLVGPVTALNMKVGELRQTLQEKYQAILPTARVMVELVEVRSNVVYVLGEVGRPGPINLPYPATVSQVISMAGGYRDTAGLSSVVLLKPDGEGNALAKLIDVNAVLTDGDFSQDETVGRYDIVYVPPSLIHSLNQAVLYGIRRMLPLESYGNVGFTYIWGQTENFTPF